jgi:hypothetical protein
MGKQRDSKLHSLFGRTTFDRFSWTTFDVTTLLPEGWQSQLIDLARNEAVARQIVPPHPTSREAADVEAVTVQGVSAQQIRNKAAWLVSLYENEFLELAQRHTREPVAIARGERHTVVLNVQTGSTMRYECHVDTNPVQGMLYVTSHAPGNGGELVVANNHLAHSIQEVECDCTTIYPMAGHLLFFDARRHPHFIRSLADKADFRVAVAMNYYTPSAPETNRPADLDEYLIGQPLP